MELNVNQNCLVTIYFYFFICVPQNKVSHTTSVLNNMRMSGLNYYSILHYWVSHHFQIGFLNAFAIIKTSGGK